MGGSGMAYSMTGFGRGEYENEKFKFVIEIKSVNHRYNDIIIKMPKKLNSLEERMKNVIKERISRGRIEVYINFEEGKVDNYSIKINEKLLDEYVVALNNISERYGAKNDTSTSLLARYPDALKIEYEETDEEVIWEALELTLRNALDLLMDMRAREGELLKKDVLGRISEIDVIISEIEKKAPEIIAVHKQKMLDRIKELIDDSIEIDEGRIAMEVAVFSDKTNITEEIVRLRSHFKQFSDILNESKSVGRKLDFLIQEINREVNTIGSKSPDIDISNYVVDMKSEIEKIREQIQNIE